jgi:ribosome-binding factor A
MGRRVDRLSGQIAKEITLLLQRSVKDPRVGFATVNRVDLSDDLYSAKVYVSVMGEEAERKATMIALQRSTGFIRTELGKVLRVRTLPEIRFILDLNLDHSFRIQELLSKIKREDPASLGIDPNATQTSETPVSEDEKAD